MNRFKNILYVNDPSVSHYALERAVKLARANGASLTIVNQVAGEGFPLSLGNLGKTIQKLDDQDIQRALEKMPTDGIKITLKHLKGISFIAIIREVQSANIDLVVKPVEGRGGYADMLFGSEDMHLIRKCPCPVWLIKPAKRKTYSRILAAVDPDPSEAENAELNALILDLASSQAIQDKSELHIVHAWEMQYESQLRSGRVNLPKFEVNRMVREVRKLHKSWFEDLIANYDFQGIEYKTHLLKGPASKVISNLAHKKRVDLIVMGTVARTGIPGFFIGNTAEKTLIKVDCSVLTVKPSGFSTPVD